MNKWIFDFTKEDPQLKRIYEDGMTYGFLRETGIYPKRALHADRLVWSETGVSISECAEDMLWQNENHYNYGGMAFRFLLPRPGTYRITVELNSSGEETHVAVAGMAAEQLLAGTPWDAAGRVTRKQSASLRESDSGAVWSYIYVAGSCKLDIEVEPAGRKDTSVGIARLSIEELALETMVKEERPAIFLLGDSTVKSYVCEEAPMAAWGQVFSRFFDESRVRIINYSQGGRSLKSMFQEGRLNDVLLSGRPGDTVFLQSGHNDESRGEPTGYEYRFGRGNTEETYCMWLKEYFLPAIYARGMQPVFVTCMTRLDNEFYTKEEEFDYDSEPVRFGGFLYGDCPHVDFPGIMLRVSEEEKIPVLDLYHESLRYLEESGGEAARSMFLSLEAGETPGKTNSGSYANGNPSLMCDGTHYKECLAKQFARLLVSDLERQKLSAARFLKHEVKEAVASGCWDSVLPELAADIRTGRNAYYRNQIEKLLLLGVMEKEADGCFYPKKEMTAEEFGKCLGKVWNSPAESSDQGVLTRQKMAVMVYDAYGRVFTKGKPRYMTAYNGTRLAPEDPNYDPNLTGDSAQYYPLTPWQNLEDRKEIDEGLCEQVRAAYELGLIRAEEGCLRGQMRNGTRLMPAQHVTKEKAAKELYFLWVLKQDILKEVHEV